MSALRSSYDIAVVGAGTFGAWTAWHLAATGRSVLLLDAWSPGHTRSSSGDESRVIRMGYGADEIYTRMSMRSLELWRDVFDRTGRPLFHRTGVVWMARAGEPYSTATHETLRRAGVKFEILSSSALAARLPQMRIDDPSVYGIYEPDSGALLARRAVAAVVDDACSKGVVYAHAAVSPPAGGRQAGVRAAGEPVRAGAFVFACGPWLPRVFPELLARRIVPTRQELFYFAPPPGDTRFAPPALPVWLDFVDPRGPYGIPDIESRGFKIGFDRHGESLDPDTEDRRVSEQGLAEIRAFLRERFPDLEHAPLAESRVCFYENSSSGDFLLDRHPAFDNVWLAGGGSGHGFKHGPAVGEYLARAIDGGAAEPRFSLATKAEVARRTVY